MKSRLLFIPHGQLNVKAIQHFSPLCPNRHYCVNDFQMQALIFSGCGVWCRMINHSLGHIVYQNFVKWSPSCCIPECLPVIFRRTIPWFHEACIMDDFGVGAGSEVFFLDDISSVNDVIRNAGIVVVIHQVPCHRKIFYSSFAIQIQNILIIKKVFFRFQCKSLYGDK